MVGDADNELSSIPSLLSTALPSVGSPSKKLVSIENSDVTKLAAAEPREATSLNTPPAKVSMLLKISRRSSALAPSCCVRVGRSGGGVIRGCVSRVTGAEGGRYRHAAALDASSSSSTRVEPIGILAATRSGNGRMGGFCQICRIRRPTPEGQFEFMRTICS
jgi:hypothetical protein